MYIIVQSYWYPTLPHLKEEKLKHLIVNLYYPGDLQRWPPVHWYTRIKFLICRRHLWLTHWDVSWTWKWYQKSVTQPIMSTWNKSNCRQPKCRQYIPKFTATYICVAGGGRHFLTCAGGRRTASTGVFDETVHIIEAYYDSRAVSLNTPGFMWLNFVFYYTTLLIGDEHTLILRVIWRYWSGRDTQFG